MKRHLWTNIYARGTYTRREHIYRGDIHMKWIYRSKKNILKKSINGYLHAIVNSRSC